MFWAEEGGGSDEEFEEDAAMVIGVEVFFPRFCEVGIEHVFGLFCEGFVLDGHAEFEV